MQLYMYILEEKAGGRRGWEKREGGGVGGERDPLSHNLLVFHVWSTSGSEMPISAACMSRKSKRYLIGLGTAVPLGTVKST